MSFSLSLGATGVATRVVLRHRLLLGLVGAHAAIAFGVARLVRDDLNASVVALLIVLLGTLAPMFVFVHLLWRVVYMLRHVKPARPSAWLMADLRATLTDTERMLGGALTLGAISLFITSFSLLKKVIPTVNPFAWDTQFAAIDRALHFGIDPYQIVMAVFGTPLMVTGFNAAYHFWLFLLYFIVFTACFTGVNAAARMRFLVGFVLTWALGGNLLGTLLSSAGPVYYHPLGLGDTFTPLMDKLAAFNTISPVWALGVQQMLWDGYTGQGSVAGISAMPSMHVASSVLMALYGFSYHRIAGCCLAVFAVIIQIGSVLLGWHYAIDGYAGAALALGCWALARKITTA